MTMFHATTAAALICLAAPHAFAQSGAVDPAQAATASDEPDYVDYAGFATLTGEVAQYRAARLLDWDSFRAEAAMDDAILLDTRSAEAFAQGHLEGAINLPFSDFTAAKLVEVLGPDTSRPVFIYCNNNFSDNTAPVVLKRAELALNIPTFINLYGYGYENIWELADTVSIADPGVPWVAGS